jgi:signal transduction histidine kinase
MESASVAEVQRRASERHERQAAAIRPIGLALLVVFLVPAVQASPGPSVTGRGMVVAVALAGFAAAVLSLLVARRPGNTRGGVVQTVGVLGVAGACLVLAASLQHDPPTQLGLALLVYTAGARLALLVGMAVAASLTAAVDAATLSNDQPLSYAVATTLLAGLLFLVAVLVTRSQADQDRAELMTAQLAESMEMREHAARLEERARIARDLHDALAHSLSGLTIQLEGARLLARKGGSGAELTATLERAATLARSGTDDARRAVAALRGDDVPGPDSLGRLVTDFSIDTGIPAKLSVDGEPSQLLPESASALYRACQEALTNIARHSGSLRVDVRLAYRFGEATLTVTDHRDGGEPRPPLLPDVGSGYGLNAMRQRVALLGGTLSAGPTGDGWMVDVRLPR